MTKQWNNKWKILPIWGKIAVLILLGIFLLLTGGILGVIFLLGIYFSLRQNTPLWLKGGFILTVIETTWLITLWLPCIISLITGTGEGCMITGWGLVFTQSFFAWGINLLAPLSKYITSLKIFSKMPYCIIMEFIPITITGIITSFMVGALIGYIVGLVVKSRGISKKQPLQK
jgi:hypothetical protein